MYRIDYQIEGFQMNFLFLIKKLTCQYNLDPSYKNKMKRNLVHLISHLQSIVLENPLEYNLIYNTKQD